MFLLFASGSLADDDPAAGLKQEFQKAKTFIVAGDLAQAEVSYRQSIALGLRQLANLSSTEGEYEQAARLLDGALKARPDDVEAQVDAAIVWFRRNDLNKAKAILQRVLTARPDHWRARNVLGRIDFFQGDFAAAIQELKAALAQQDDFETAYSLTICYLKAKKVSEASILFSEMLHSMKPSAALHALIGRAYAAAGFSEQAIPEFREALKLDPKYPRVHMLLAYSYLQQFGEQAYPQARDALEQELKLEPDEYSALLLLGTVAVGQRDYTAALAALEHAIGVRPQSPDPYLFLGETYTALNRAQAAIAALEKYIELAGDDAGQLYDVSRAYYLLGQALLRIGRDPEGKKALARSKELHEAKFKYGQQHMFEEKQQSSGGESRTSERVTELLQANAKDESDSLQAMVKTDLPGMARASKPSQTKEVAQYRVFVSEILASSYNDLGVMRAKDAKYAEAAEFFQHAAAWNSNLEGLDRNWGLASFRANLYAEAIPPLERQLARRPDDALVRQLLGLSYFFTDNYTKTAEVLRPFRENPPSDPGLLYAWGTSLVRTRQSNDASKIFRLLLEQNSANPEVHFLLAQAYGQQEDYPHALEELQTALRLDPQVPEVHYYAGLVHLREGQLDAAADEFRAELQTHPTDTQAQYHLAYVLLTQGKLAPAVTMLQEVIQRKSDYEVARFALGRALLQQGDVSGAIENLEAAKKLAPDRDATYYQLSQAYRRAGRTQDAELALAKYRELRESSRLKKRETLETEKP